MNRKASELLEEFRPQGLLSERIGPDPTLRAIASVDAAEPGDLVFVPREDFVERALQGRPSAVVTSRALAPRFAARPDLCVLVSDRVGLAHAKIRLAYGDRNVRDTEWGKRHASAVIHETAELHESVIVGPQSVIGARVRIGANSVIMSGVIIEHDTAIGSGTVIHPRVVIGYDSRIGNNVIVKSGVVLGMEGFGFERDEHGASHRVPQVGRVVIEDDVVLGANTCVDRAAYGQTIVRRGTKTDNHCHIAHNVDIGEDCLLTAGFIVAGSTRIGNRVMASGQTGILDHLEIADDVVLVYRAGVTADIPKAGVYAGKPAIPLADFLKSSAIFARLSELRSRVRELEKRQRDG